MDPARAQAAQDANVQEVLLCPFFCSFSVAFRSHVAVGFGFLSYHVSMLVFAAFINFTPCTFALVFPEGFGFLLPHGRCYLLLPLLHSFSFAQRVLLEFSQHEKILTLLRYGRCYLLLHLLNSFCVARFAGLFPT